jgi:hypothetical protein
MRPCRSPFPLKLDLWPSPYTYRGQRAHPRKLPLRFPNLRGHEVNVELRALRPHMVAIGPE